jgi:hypothetical protein
MYSDCVWWLYVPLMAIKKIKKCEKKLLATLILASSGVYEGWGSVVKSGINKKKKDFIKKLSFNY